MSDVKCVAMNKNCSVVRLMLCRITYCVGLVSANIITINMKILLCFFCFTFNHEHRSPEFVLLVVHSW